MNCESVAPSHAKTIGTNFALKSFHAIINLVSELWNTRELPLRILYFTPTFTDMLLYTVLTMVFYAANLYAREPPKLRFASDGGGLEVVESARRVQ